jgi:site-specific recombinase XerD
LGYLRSQGAAPTAEAPVPATPVDRLLAAFADYLVRERGLSAASVKSYRHHARPFLAGLAAPLDAALAELSSAHWLQAYLPVTESCLSTADCVT